MTERLWHSAHNREWVYKDITPRIVCERLLTDPVWGSPTEYAFHCFDGEPRFLRVTTDRASGKLGTDTFDLQWQKPPFAVNRADSGRITERPSNFDEMADCARRLSRGWPFVRVDFFGVEGRTIFQELSWHPAAGGNRFIPESYDRATGATNCSSRPRSGNLAGAPRRCSWHAPSAGICAAPYGGEPG